MHLVVYKCLTGRTIPHLQRPTRIFEVQYCQLHERGVVIGGMNLIDQTIYSTKYPKLCF